MRAAERPSPAPSRIRLTPNDASSNGAGGKTPRFFTGRSAAGTTRIEVSVFRFADPNAAAQALDYFLRGRAAGTALTEVAPPAGPPGTRALAGPIPGGQEATVYFSQGAELYRVTAIGSGD